MRRRGGGRHVHVRAAKGVVRMWRTSGQELPSPFPDDASLAADKVCESQGGRNSPSRLRNWKPPTSPLRPWPRQKVETRYLSLFLSLSRMARMAKISPTTASGVPRFMDNLTVCCCIVFEHRSRLFFDSWWIWSGKLSPLVEYRCYYQLFRFRTVAKCVFSKKCAGISIASDYSRIFLFNC